MYDIDPSLPEEEQRRQRKAIRAARRAERAERRKGRDDAAGGGGGDGSDTSPKTSARSSSQAPPSDEPKEGSAAWEWAQKQKQVTAAKEAERTASRDAELAALKEQRAAEAAEARLAAKRKEQEQLAEEERQRGIREHQQRVRAEAADAELQAQRRAEKADKARAKEEAAARAAEEAAALEARAQRRREEEARMRREEEEQRARDEADRARLEALRKKRLEEQRLEAAKREAEAAATRAAEGERYARRRELLERELKTAEAERWDMLSADEREAILQARADHARTDERRLRVAMVLSDQQRVAEERVRGRFASLVSAVRSEEDWALRNKREHAGAMTTEWLYHETSLRVFYSLAALRRLAAHQRLVFGVPEWVVVGRAGCAKANVVDALLGMSVFRGSAVARPFRIQLRFDAAAEDAPRAEFALEDGERVAVEPFKIPADVAARNVAGSQGEAVLTVFFKYLIDVDVLVTADVDSADAVLSPAACGAVVEAARPVSRIVLWVERCDAATTAVGGQYARLMGASDPAYQRSILVVGGLSDALAEFTLTSEANALVGLPSPARVFFVSFSTEKVTRSSVLSLYESDVDALKRLKTNHALDARVGLPKLGAHLHQLTWSMYQRVLVPRLLAQVTTTTGRLEHALASVQRQLDSLAPQELRAFASRYLMEYLHAFRAALSGVAGDPRCLADARGARAHHSFCSPTACSTNGETLSEERKATGMGHGWSIGSRAPVRVESSAVPRAKVKLVGRPAFERLLAEFASAVDAAPLETSLQSGANAGPGRSGVAADMAQSSTDVAVSVARVMLRPLVLAALKRASHIAQKLTAATESAMMHRKAWQTRYE